MSDRFRGWLLSTPFGQIALANRAWVELAMTVLFRRERVAAAVNDLLAFELVTQLCKAGRTYIDVGAHIGSLISATLRHCRDVRVIAIEAVPEKADRLRRRFPRVLVHACAVAESSGEVSFFVDTRQSGYSSLRASQETPHSREIRVPLHTLDELVSSDDVDVIKIDVEGAELRVLQGGDALISRTRPTLMFESGPAQIDTKGDLWDWLNKRGYLVMLPVRVAHNAPPLTREGFVDSHYYPRHTTNYFGVPRERRVEIRDAARRILRL